MEYQYSDRMKEAFVKKYWDENSTLFYLYFQDDKAIKQVEVTNEYRRFLSLDNPINGDSLLYDQTIDELDLQETDFITKEEFYKIWNSK